MDKDNLNKLKEAIKEIKTLSFAFCDDDSNKVSLMAQKINILAHESQKIIDRYS